MSIETARLRSRVVSSYIYNHPTVLPAALNAELTRDPYVPLLLHLSDGRTREVPNPGLCFINRGALYLARIDRPQSRLADDLDVISLRHIVSVEQLDAA